MTRSDHADSNRNEELEEHEEMNEGEQEEKGEREEGEIRSANKDGSRYRRDRGRRPSVGRAAWYAIQIGFFAGVVWGLVRWLAVSLNLTKVPQAFLADPWLPRSNLNTVFWQCSGLLLFILMSVIAALIYWLILGTLQGPWPGILFGAAWWVLLFLLIGPRAGLTESVKLIGWHSITLELGLYLCWGLFIGYSIAFEFHNEAAREPTKKANGGRKRTQPAT